MPRYLEKRGTNGNQEIIARFRLGNEENSNKNWLKKEQRACRVCSWEEESLEYIWRCCVGSREWDGDAEDRLRDDGEGVRWMRKVLKRTKELSH